jgi:plastocyanin
MVKKTLFLIAACAMAASVAAGNVQVQVLDKEGRPVPDAVVVVYPSAPAAPVASNVTIGQQRMRFVPLVTVVAPGSRVRFTNLDRWDHHIRGTAAVNSVPGAPSGANFEMRLAGATADAMGGEADVVVQAPGAVLLGCHLHGSMRGHLFVTDSAHTLKTDADGIARFDQIPEGAAQLRVWHPEQLVDLPRRALQIGAAPVLESVPLSVVPRRRRS